MAELTCDRGALGQIGCISTPQDQRHCAVCRGRPFETQCLASFGRQTRRRDLERIALRESEEGSAQEGKDGLNAHLVDERRVWYICLNERPRTNEGEQGRRRYRNGAFAYLLISVARQRTYVINNATRLYRDRGARRGSTTSPWRPNGGGGFVDVRDPAPCAVVATSSVTELCLRQVGVALSHTLCLPCPSSGL